MTVDVGRDETFEAAVPDGRRRDRSAARRDVAASRRDVAAEHRDARAFERDEGARARDAATAAQDLDGLRRDEAAVLRDRAGTDRDSAAELRDRPPFGRGAERVSVRDVMAARRAAAADREHARLDRGFARADRSLAVRDRLRSVLDRGASEQDRNTSLTDRRASGNQRMSAAGDRNEAHSDRDGAAADRRSASLDELTGAYLRRPGLLQLERDLSRASREGGRLVVAFVDVDHLKKVNDDGGHAAGDKLLQHVAKALTTHLRPHDLIIRFGGDEFVCVVAGLGLGDVARRLESANTMLGEDITHGSFTLGLAQLQYGETGVELIERADRALYEKRATRPQALEA